MSNTGGTGDGDPKGEPKGMKVEQVIELAQSYVTLTGEVEKENLEVLALFCSAIVDYFAETYGLDVSRHRFQRTAIFAMGMLRAAYGMGASKGMPAGKGGIQ